MPGSSALTLRRLPNIAVSGTPGTGKSTFCSMIASALPDLRYINISAEVETRGCRGVFDRRLRTWEVDEVKLLQSLREDLKQGGALLDWIHADYLIQEYDGSDDDKSTLSEEEEEGEKEEDEMIDLVIQMRADTATLFDRYKARGYDDEKIQENLDCEIMDEIGSENRDVYDERKCVVLQGVAKEAEDNLARVVAWYKAWQENQASA